jgi:hypothetical protein
MAMRTHLQFVPFVVDGFGTVSVMEWGAVISNWLQEEESMHGSQSRLM